MRRFQEAVIVSAKTHIQRGGAERPAACDSTRGNKSTELFPRSESQAAGRSAPPHPAPLRCVCVFTLKVPLCCVLRALPVAFRFCFQRAWMCYVYCGVHKCRVFLEKWIQFAFLAESDSLFQKWKKRCKYNGSLLQRGESGCASCFAVAVIFHSVCLADAGGMAVCLRGLLLFIQPFLFFSFRSIE
jgi:hypothetical protein